MAVAVSTAYGVDRPIRVLQSAHPSLLVTWGWLRPVIILPRAAAAWSARRMRIVLSHELAHVSRGDWAVQMVAGLIRAAYWFNPVVWVACRQLRDASEEACDDAVIASGIRNIDYAEELVTVARALAAARCDWHPAPAMARPSSLERRVTAMLTQRTDRRPAAWTARLTTSLAVALLAVMVAGFDVLAQSFATLSGTVVDQTGAFVPRASLVLVKRDADARYEIHSSDTGVYSFEGLAPGRYELQAQSPGFRNLVGEVVVDGRNLQRNITLQVGALQETISIVHRAGDPVETGDRPRQPRRESFVGNTACVPSVVGGRIEPPTKIADARPRYPAQLAASSAGAVIVLNTVIGTDGFVRDARAAEPGADPDFLASAIAAVQQWQFTPTLLNCVPIEVEMTVTARFSVR